MYAYYFNSEALRWLTVLTAVLYSIFYSAVQLLASAALFNVICGVPVTVGAMFMAFIVWFYIVAGGMKASTWVGVIQFVLMIGGIIILGAYVLAQFGGFSNFMAEVNKLESKYMEIPGMIYFGLGRKWTAIYILTLHVRPDGYSKLTGVYHVELRYQVAQAPGLATDTYMTVFVVGFSLFFFAAFQGLGARILQMQGVAGFAELARDVSVVPLLMKEFLPPVMLGIVFMGAISAIHCHGGPLCGHRGIHFRCVMSTGAIFATNKPVTPEQSLGEPHFCNGHYGAGPCGWA